MIPQYAPMHPTLVRAPFDRPGWIYEGKVDGYRMLAYKDGARIRLVSRRGVDHTQRFHDLAVAVAGLKPQPLVLDGEVAIFEQQLRSRFDWLRESPDELGHTARPDRVRCAVRQGPRFAEDENVIQTLAPDRTDEALGEGFCQGLCGAVRTSSISMLFTRCRNGWP
jgi:hypothetical protein